MKDQTITLTKSIHQTWWFDSDYRMALCHKEFRRYIPKPDATRVMLTVSKKRHLGRWFKFIVQKTISGPRWSYGGKPMSCDMSCFIHAWICDNCKTNKLYTYYAKVTVL